MIKDNYDILNTTCGMPNCDTINQVDRLDPESYKYLPKPIHSLIRESQNKVMIKKGLNLKKRIEICKKLFSIYNECSEYEKECIQKIIEKL